MSFIVFEGGDKCGKTSMVDLVVKKLVSLGWKAAPLSFPRYDQLTGSVISKIFCEQIGVCHLAGPNAGQRAPEQQLVFEALHLLDKWSAVGEVRKRDREGAITVVSRWKQSALVYAKDAGFDESYFRSFLDFLPDANFNVLLDVDEEAALARMPPLSEQDSYERDRAKQSRIRQAYRKYWEEKAAEKISNPLETWCVIDASCGREEVFAAVWDEVVVRLKRRFR